jgi:flavin-dependent dehydrogenase
VPLRSAGLISTWGLEAGVAVEDALSRTSGPSFHIDRGAFDRMLLKAAEAAGVLVCQGARLTRFERSAGWWRCGPLPKVMQPAEPGQLAHDRGDSLLCRFIIDTTGRAAILARRQGALRQRCDNQVAFGALFAAAGADQRHLIEPVEPGWFYSGLLPDDRRAVILFTDRDLTRKLRDPKPWRECLASTRVLSEWLASARRTTAFIVRAASTCYLDTPIGDGWLAAGDAAFAFDPLSGQGLVKALANAFWAAYAAADLLAGKAEAAAKYRQVVLGEVAPFLEQRREIYQRETRFAAKPFWKRRQERSDLA